MQVVHVEHVLTGKDGRNTYIDLLQSLGEKYKKQRWGWAWLPALALPDLEKALAVGGAGYPVSFFFH